MIINPIAGCLVYKLRKKLSHKHGIPPRIGGFVDASPFPSGECFQVPC